MYLSTKCIKYTILNPQIKYFTPKEELERKLVALIQAYGRDLRGMQEVIVIVLSVGLCV